MTTTYLTPREVASRLKVNPATVRNLCHQGQIPALRFGGSWRIEEAGLDAYLASRRITPKAPTKMRAAG